MTELRFHPLSEIFPLIEGDHFRSFVDDIKQNGLREPITLDKAEEEGGAILDGRNRYQACLAADVEPVFDVLPAGIEPLAFILSRNVHRRHMNEGQRGMAAAKLCTLARGRPKENPSIEGITAEKAAALLNVSVATVERARSVLEHAAPELREVVERGGTSVSAAAEVARLPEDQQRDIVKKGPARIVSVAKTLRKQEIRNLREIEAGSQMLQDPQERAGIILIDLPWKTINYSEVTGSDRAAENHYTTMTLDEIRAFPINKFAADDCYIFFWVTGPFLSAGLRILEDAWGFTYKARIVWVKDRRGNGKLVIDQAEELIIAARGHPVAPAIGTQPLSVVFGGGIDSLLENGGHAEAPRGQHSEKPICFTEMIERHWPNTPKREVFARGKTRPGWLPKWGYGVTDDPVSEGIDSDESESYETEEDDGGEHVDQAQELQEAGADGTASANHTIAADQGDEDADTDQAGDAVARYSAKGRSGARYRKREAGGQHSSVGESVAGAPDQSAAPANGSAGNGSAAAASGNAGGDDASGDPFAPLTYNRKPPPRPEQLPELPAAVRRAG